ncbi:MAG: hypothetical protein E7197_08775 [Anaerovibrio sp.]|uniref:ADP-ribosyltransferase-containing protein n=1 Tax=Anaerovibrio sp. TaxID=1872532 RepID=UPI0025C15273|nr:hypothetical protein [Anaerovibrio sp.]MBE6100131.1 hypothetical protein [Anaerovibrio sp.]
MEVYETNKKGTSLDSFRVIYPGLKEQAPFIDYKLSQIFSSVNNVSKVVEENGEPLVVYHGTPLGGFDTFNRELNYFTADKEYADRYQDPGASSDYVKGVREELGEAMTYSVFLNIKKPFDTRNAKERL